MQTWIYSPLQRIASDSGGEGGGEEGRERRRELTGVGGKWSETKRAGMARRSSNKVSYKVSCEGGLKLLSVYFKFNSGQKQFNSINKLWLFDNFYQCQLALYVYLK